MLYITGDVHADAQKWYAHIHPLLKEGDCILVAGDFGFGFWKTTRWSDEPFYDWLARQPYTVLVVDGNHENFDELAACPTKLRFGGQVHEVRHNLLHLMRGEIFDLEGCSVFAFGGGYSLDKAWRVEGESWWPQEMPSDAEYLHAEETLAKHHHKVDFIVTHTAPAETVYYLSTKGAYGLSRNIPDEYRLNAFLEEVQVNTQYQHLYFGHFHLDEELWRSQTAISHDVRELKTGKRIYHCPLTL